MFKKLWLRIRFLNVWNWAQLGVMLFTLICFVLITMFSFTYIIEQQGREVLEKDSQAVKYFMQENASRLTDAANRIARLVETGDKVKLDAIHKASYVELVDKNQKVKFDIMFILDNNGSLLFCTNGCLASGGELRLSAVRAALKGDRVVAMERLPQNILKEEGLEKQAQVKIQGSAKIITDAIARLTAVPFYRNGKQAGVVVVGMLVNNYPYLPDWFANREHGMLSVFLDGYRISTSLTDKNNNRMLGTVIPEKVSQKLYNEKKPYTARVDLNGKALAKYEFMYNADQKPVAVLEIAEDYGRFISVFRNVGIFIWAVALILGLIMVLVLRRLNLFIIRPINNIIDGVVHLARSDFSYRVSMDHDIKCWQVMECTNTDCSLYHGEEIACWLVEHTYCTGKRSIDEKLDYCQKCPVYLTYCRNETTQLVATFNYMASIFQNQTTTLKERQHKLYELIKELDDYESVVLTLALAVEAKDTYTLGHSERVSSYALALGKKVRLNANELETLRIGTLLHDIGKIAVGDNILRKPTSLTREEFNIVQEHPGRGANICVNLKFAKDSLPIILHHHERYDGKGYPTSLKEDKIPFIVRITTIADAFDAMTSNRPYRKGMNLEQAIQELRNNAGRQFDPVLADTFIEMLENDEVVILKTHNIGA